MDIPANAKYAIIRETWQRTDNLLSIKQLCSLAGVSRSGYYHYLGTEDDGQTAPGKAGSGRLSADRGGLPVPRLYQRCAWDLYAADPHGSSGGDGPQENSTVDEKIWTEMP